MAKQKYKVVGSVRTSFNITVEIDDEDIAEGSRGLENAIQNEVEEIIEDGRFDHEFDVGDVDASDFKLIEDSPQPDWSLPEKLERLNITAPANWNDYNTYLLEGGTLEYEDWNRTTIKAFDHD